MEYDFRNRAGQSPYQAQPHVSMYRPATGSVHSSSSSHLYPRLGQHGQPVIPPTGRAPPYQHGSSQPPPPGTGIRVGIKPEYRITPPPQMSPHLREVPRSNFQFNFELERKILAEAEKETQNWSQLGSEIVPPRAAEPVPSVTPRADPVMSKYIASGLNREAVSLALAHYGDNPTKVQEFVKGYTLLQEMGFSSNKVAEVLLMYDNDTDKALAQFLNVSS